MRKKYWLILLILLLLIPFLMWLVLWTSSSQVKLQTQKTVEQIVELLPGEQNLASTAWGEEKIIPIEIVNEHPDYRLSQSDLISFDVITERFQTTLSEQQIDKIEIHLTNVPQLFNQSADIDLSVDLTGFSADEDEEQHIFYAYLFLNSAQTLQTYTLTTTEIIEQLEHNLIGSLVLLRHDGKYFEGDELLDEVLSEYRVINDSKHQVLLFDLEQL